MRAMIHGTGRMIKTSVICLALIFTTSFGAYAGTVMDFDGDGKSDVVVARPVGGNLIWYLQRSQAGFQGVQWGAYPNTSTPDRVVPADYDGDNKWDIAVWRPGAQATFYILRSQTNTLQVIPWGSTGDDPYMTQDFDGDNKADPTVVRRANGYLNWYIRQSTNNQLRAVSYGLSNLDVPVRGNYDGDTKADLAVYRGGFPNPASTFYVLKSSNGALLTQKFGNAADDVIVPGDYDGDNKTDFAVFRVDTGVWYWMRSTNGQVQGLAFGNGNIDSSVQGDYDGDGKTDVAVRRDSGSAAGTFYIQRTTAGFTAMQFGIGLNDLLVGGVLQNTYNPF